MKTRVKVVFPAERPDRPSWPYINYDVERRSNEIIALLQQQLPSFDFTVAIYYQAEEAERELGADKAEYDGYLVYMTALWTGVPEFYARHAWPVIVADELYSGSGGLLRVHSLVRDEVLPVVTVASSNLQDIVDALRLIAVVSQMRQARILTVADEETWGSDHQTLAGALDIFGAQVTGMGSGALLSYYQSVDAQEAERWADRWIEQAAKVVEPDRTEIRRSARMYLALKEAMKDLRADAVTIDCLGLYYAGQLPAYPCLALFQLNNDGSTGVCEADVDSALTQLLIRYATGRPGYVSDPVIDTATQQIVYAHCTATNRPFGPDGPGNPYIIRSHAEDGKGAAVQSLLPLGQKVTTAKVSVKHRAFAIHGGKTVANVGGDRACRTKLAASVKAQRILDNYHSELFGWHRVTCYGDHRRQLVDLARLYGLRLIEEDR